MGNETSSCCDDGSPSGGCGCEAPSGRRCWLKALIFVVVIAAAVIVGAYSLWKQPGQAGPGPGKGVSGTEATAPAIGGGVADCAKECDKPAQSSCCDE